MVQVFPGNNPGNNANDKFHGCKDSKLGKKDVRLLTLDFIGFSDV